MSKPYQVTRTTLPTVLVKLGEYMADRENATVTKTDKTAEQHDFCAALTRYLDYLMSQDAFGTEGQNDPRRGDRRND